MCRLSAFFGAPICAADLVTRPCRSIITQSFDARERMSGDASTPGYLNGDGFGLGWYSSNRDDVIPCIYRQARPAWNDPNLGPIAEKVYTPVLFAHVRAASPGLDVSETTCHPFRYGRYLWMHNGCLGNFPLVRRKLLATLSEDAFDFAVSHGSSDTALCFAVFLNLIDDKMAEGSPESLRSCLEQTINILDKALREVNATKVSLLNFVVSDGESIAASRYVINLQDDMARAASLYYASGNCYESDGSAPGNYVMTHTDRRPSLAIISSEPLTERRADWVSVPRNSCLVITKSMHILVSPIMSSPDPRISRILANLRHSKILEQRSSLRNPTKVVEKRLQSKRVEQSTDYSSSSGNINSAGITVRSTITIPGRTVLCCAVLGNLLCSGTDDGTIHVWNIEDTMPSEVLRAGHRPVMAMLADAEIGVLISAAAASTVTVHKLTPEKRLEPSFVTCYHEKGDILSLTRIGKKIFAGFSDTTVRCVIEDIFRVGETSSSVGKATSDPGSDGSSSIRDIATGLPTFDFPRTTARASHYGYVFAVASCRDGQFLCTGCGDGLLRVWNVKTEECIQKRGDHAGAILALVTYEVEYGTMLFSGSRDGSVKVWVWDGDNGFICKRTLRKHKDEVVFLTLFDDKLVSGSADGHVCVWCAESVALLCQYRDNSLKAGSVSVRYNLLFTATSEGGIHIRDMLSTESELGLKNKESKRMANGEHNLAMTNTTSSPIQSRSSSIQVRSGSNTPKQRLARRKAESNGNGTVDPIVTEVHEDTDDSETLVPGVTNEMVLAPPMSPISRKGESHEADLSTLHGKEANIDAIDEDIQPIDLLPRACPKARPQKGSLPFSSQAFERRLMQDVLARFLSFASVSGSEDHREDCWQAARYIGRFLENLGASVKYVSTSTEAKAKAESTDSILSIGSSTEPTFSGPNPIVLARFESSKPSARTVAFYGHYDVMPVDFQQWERDPWTLTSINGYFYGRGSTDNKGPIIAMIFAIKKLLEESRDGLGSNLVLILQGEGETSNSGFKECVTSHRHWFDNTGLILTSNSYWLGEEKPCLTYGFRGIIELRVSVTGASRNLHSGVDGGAIFEPMNDLTTVLGTMVDASGEVCIPGFYEDIRPMTETEKKLLTSVDFSTEEYHQATGVTRFTSENAADLLEARWRQPSISITSIETSNISNFYSIVPRQASANVSIRFVPDQDPSKIEKAIMTHLGFEMRKRRSPNKLNVECVHKGDWWLGDPAGPQFQIAERAVKSVWGVAPEYVREGGSMPLFSSLAKTLDAPLVQVPLGQSSDSAHLPNERIRAINLFRGKEVLQKIIQEFAESGL